MNELIITAAQIGGGGEEKVAPLHCLVLPLARFPGMGSLDLTQSDQSQMARTGGPYRGWCLGGLDALRTFLCCGPEEGQVSVSLLPLLQSSVHDCQPPGCLPALDFQEVPICRCSAGLSCRRGPHAPQSRKPCNINDLSGACDLPGSTLGLGV